jgi:hypothetical protein
LKQSSIKREHPSERIWGFLKAHPSRWFTTGQIRKELNLSPTEATHGLKQLRIRDMINHHYEKGIKRYWYGD